MDAPKACAWCEVPLATGREAPHYVRLTEHYPPDPHDSTAPTKQKVWACDWQCLLHWMVNEMLPD